MTDHSDDSVDKMLTSVYIIKTQPISKALIQDLAINKKKYYTVTD